LTAILTPLVGSGTLNETLAFSSNAVNAGAITALLTGVATNLSLTSTTLALTSSASPVYGQAVTVQATVASQRAGVSPSGTVTFTLNGKTSGKIALSTGTSPYTASYTFAGLQLAAGANVVNAFYSGDASNAGSNASAPLVVTVSKQATSGATIASTASASGPSTVIVTQLTQTPGSTFYFDVTVSPAGIGSPSGTVNLVLAGTNSPILATATLSSTGWAQLSYTTPATAAAGTYRYQVVYGGDSNFNGSTSAAAAIQISPETYVISLPANTYYVAAGASIVVPITVTGLGGYTGNVTVGLVTPTMPVGVNSPPTITSACTGMPANTSCVFSPGIVALTNGSYPATNPSGVFNLTINTNIAPATPYASSLLWPGCLAGMLALLAAARKRGGVLRVRLLVLAFGLALSGAVLGMGGCGSGSNFQTPVGTSSVTVSFSGSPIGGYPQTPTNPPSNNPAIPNTTTFQLTVQ
jgi:hypothetical protein